MGIAWQTHPCNPRAFRPSPSSSCGPSVRTVPPRPTHRRMPTSLPPREFLLSSSSPLPSHPLASHLVLHRPFEKKLPPGWCGAGPGSDPRRWPSFRSVDLTRVGFQWKGKWTSNRTQTQTKAKERHWRRDGMGPSETATGKQQTDVRRR